MARPEARAPSAAVGTGEPAPIGPGLGLALWAGLLFAFSPSIAAGLESLRSQPWTRGTLIFALLAVVAVRSAPPARRSAAGWALVAAGIAIQLVAIGGGVARAGRLGFVLAAVGLCRGAGWAGWRTALLLGFLLPLPHAVVELASPGLEGAFAAAAAALARGVGLGVEAGRGVLVSGSETLRLADHDGGLAWGALLAGLAWFAELRAPSPSPARRLARVAGWLAATIAGPLGFLTIAALVLGAGVEGAAARGRAILDHLPWLLTWTFGIVLAGRLGRPRGGERA